MDGSKLHLDDQLCFALYAATNAITRAYRPLLNQLQLTYPQYLVMLALWQDGSMPLGRIAERLQLGANAVAPIVDNLEATGYVTRQRDQNDRRVVHVVLTDRGRDLEGSAADAQANVACRIGYTASQYDALREELQKLARIISDASGQTVPPRV